MHFKIAQQSGFSMKFLDTLFEIAGWIFGFPMQMPRERNEEKSCPLKEKAYFHEVEHSLLVSQDRETLTLGWLEALGLSVLSIKGLGETLFRVSIAVMKDCDQRQVGEARVYLLYPHHHCPSLKEVRTGTQTGQEAGGSRSWKGAAYWRVYQLLLSSLPYGAQDHEPWDGSTLNGLGPPINH